MLHGVDLVVPEGSVVALLGPNGAGKTTTLKVAGRAAPATAGDVLVAGRRVNGARPDELARRGLCLIPEGRGIFPNLTVRENLRMMTHRGQRSPSGRGASPTPASRGSSRRHDQIAGTLSGGEQQMLAMARGLATDPALLLLDELSMGLAPIIVEELYEIVAQVATEGVSILRGRAVRPHRPGRRRRGGDHGARPRSSQVGAPTSSKQACPRPTWADEEDDAMIEQPDRVEQFKAEIAEMRLPGPCQRARPAVPPPRRAR